MDRLVSKINLVIIRDSVVTAKLQSHKSEGKMLLRPYSLSSLARMGQE